MSVKQQLVTAEELWEMPEVPGKRFELVDGGDILPGFSVRVGDLFEVRLRG